MAKVLSHLSEFVQDKPAGFLTEFLQSLIDNGEELFTVDAEGIWFEIDSHQDLDLALASQETKRIVEETLSWKKFKSRK